MKFKNILTLGIKPFSIAQMNTKTGETLELNLNEYFYSAWRTYYPRTKLFSLNNESQSVLLYEKTTNELYKIDFKTKEIFKLEKSLREANSSAQHYIKKAQKSINKFFVDQAQTYDMMQLADGMNSGDEFMAYKCDSNQLSLLNFKNNVEFNIDLNLESDFKLRVSHLSQLGESTILISGYDVSSLKNDSDSLEPRNLKYFVLNYSNGELNLASASDKFKLSSVEPNLLGSVNDLILNEIELKNYDKSQVNYSISL